MSAEDPLRVAIVGSGPAGFYAAGHLLAGERSARRGRPVRPAADPVRARPRSASRPTIPKIKSVSRVYEKTAARPGFRFFGNVEVGRDVTHEELARPLPRRRLRVRRADRPPPRDPRRGSARLQAATAFVAWYNGHPDFPDLEFDLSRERAVVIGNGNVALDVARMLALTPR